MTDQAHHRVEVMDIVTCVIMALACCISQHMGVPYRIVDKVRAFLVVLEMATMRA